MNELDRYSSFMLSDGDIDQDSLGYRTMVFSALVELCADICRRNGKRKLVWIADRDKALSYEVRPEEMLITVHRWFARKSCPGNWLMERLGSLADEVNCKLGV